MGSEVTNWGSPGREFLKIAGLLCLCGEFDRADAGELREAVDGGLGYNSTPTHFGYESYMSVRSSITFRVRRYRTVEIDDKRLRCDGCAVENRAGGICPTDRTW